MKKRIQIIGGGASALLLAAHLDPLLWEVHLYEKNQTLGRKFLVAGDGGLNLSHSESFEQFVERYKPHSFLQTALHHFTPTDLRHWLTQLGIETYVGTSGRIFPEKGIKPISVLNTIEKKLLELKVQFHFQEEWKGFDASGSLLMENKVEIYSLPKCTTVFALGGGSWPVTGCSSDWLHYFDGFGISVLPFAASNAALKINWPPQVATKLAGHALKNIALYTPNEYRKGELSLTSSGLEGGAAYWFCNAIRQQLHENKEALLMLDLKPVLSEAAILEKLNEPRRQSIAHHIKSQIHLDQTQIALLQAFCTKEEFNSNQCLAQKIKALPLAIEGLASVEEAISTVGGIALQEVAASFELKKLPQHYAIGEMLDWDAPTGGYLLQAAFSMGVYVADCLNKEAKH